MADLVAGHSEIRFTLMNKDTPTVEVLQKSEETAFWGQYLKWVLIFRQMTK